MTASPGTDASTVVGPRHKVFISHASKDLKRIQGLVLLLRGLGHEAFVASDSIPLGSDWEARLRAELRACDMLIVMWTKHASKSRWVRRECELTVEADADRPIVPISLDDTPLSDVLAARQGVVIPLIDTVLETTREARRRRLPPREIDAALRSLLLEHGIALGRTDFDKVRTFASGTMTGLWAASLASSLWSSTMTKAIVVVGGGLGATAAVGVVVGRAGPSIPPASSTAVSSETRRSGDQAAEPEPAEPEPAEPEPAEPEPAEPEPAEPSGGAPPRECPNGIVLDMHARLTPEGTDWDLAPGDQAKPDFAGYVELEGMRERLRLRNDRIRVTAPFFAGQRVRIAGSMKLEIYDVDLNFHDSMASARVDVADLFTKSGATVGSLDVSARCRK